MIKTGEVSFLVMSLQKVFTKDEKLSRKYEPPKDEDAVNKSYLDTKIADVNEHISYIEKSCNNIKKFERYNKQSDEEFLIERASQTNTQILYDKGFFVKWENLGDVLKDYLSIEVNEKGRLDKDPINVNVIQ